MRQSKQSELFTKKILQYIFLATGKPLYLHSEIKKTDICTTKNIKK